jgi:V-type H+-transporting ATPase subunit C
MSEYWLISIPGDKTPAQAFETLNNATSKQNSLSTNYKFPIPDLKVGNLI